MEKLLFISTWDFADGPSTGITNKIKAQMKAFEKNGFQVDYTYISGNDAVFCKNGEEVVLGQVGKLRKLAANYYLWCRMKQENYKYVYSRYALSDYFYIKLLGLFSKRNSTVIVEMPTFPYDKEQLPGIVWWGLYTIDKIFRVKLKKVVNYIATYSTNGEILGIPTVSMYNGIDFEATSLRTPQNETKEIRLLAVAALAKWHGYDRLLVGLAEYYKKPRDREVIFHIVGDGPVRKEYEEIVERYNIGKYVVFHGMKYKDELDAFYDMCDIGIENFGFHRSGILYSSTLKSREYGAKGLPFVTSCKVDVFEDVDFVLNMRPCEEPIDVEEIVKFYDMMYNCNDKLKIAKRIRNIASKRCNIVNTILPVVEKFRG